VCIDVTWVSTAAFSESWPDGQLPEMLRECVVVVRFSFGLLISVSLALTVYFGAAAWRLTGDPPNESLGSGHAFHLVHPQQP